MANTTITNRAQSEFVTFARKVEATYGTVPAAGADWEAIEPDQVNQFENEYIRERRDPFNVDRLMRKQILTGVSAMAAFEGDVTDKHLQWLMPRALLAEWQDPQPEVNVLGITAGKFTVATANIGPLAVGTVVRWNRKARTDGPREGILLVINSIADVTGGKEYTCRVVVQGDTGNGYVKDVGRTGDNDWDAVAGYTANTSSVTVIGHRFENKIGTGAATTDNLVYSSTSLEAGSSEKPNLSSSALKYRAGMGIYIAVHDDTNVAAVRQLRGFARAVTSDDGSITFERSETSGIASATIAGGTTQTACAKLYVFTSNYIRNVPADNDKWCLDSDTIVAQYAKVDGTNTHYEAMTGCHLNTLGLRFPQQARVRYQADFMASAKRGQSDAPWGTNALIPPSVESMATSVDIGRAKLFTDTGGDISTLLQNVDLQFQNNIEGDYTLDRLESRGPQVGKFGLQATVTALIASTGEFSAVESEQVGNLQIAGGNSDGHWMIDIPRMTLTAGRKNFDRNRTLKIDYDVDYIPFDTDDSYQSAVIVSRFGWLPIKGTALIE